jgi:large subunit ribosomal protein L23
MGLFSKKKKVEKKDSSNEVKKQVKKPAEVKVAEKVKKEKDKKNKDVKTVKSEFKHEHGNAYKHLVRPIITEKASFLGMNNSYLFEVYPKSNKIEISKSIQKLYGVKPVKINIMKVRGKKVRYGRKFGNQKSWKKAIITLKQGDKIEIYEGV